MTEVEFEDETPEASPDSDYDVDETIEQFETGYKLKVTCKRGTGTNDRDEVKGELKSREEPTREERASLIDDVTTTMAQLRAFQPDPDE